MTINDMNTVSTGADLSQGTRLRGITTQFARKFRDVADFVEGRGAERIEKAASTVSARTRQTVSGARTFAVDRPILTTSLAVGAGAFLMMMARRR